MSDPKNIDPTIPQPPADEKESSDEKDGMSTGIDPAIPNPPESEIEDESEE